jgi:hypothetical protein
MDVVDAIYLPSHGFRSSSYYISRHLGGRRLRSADCAYDNCVLVMAAADEGRPTAAGSTLSVVVDPKTADRGRGWRVTKRAAHRSLI